MKVNVSYTAYIPDDKVTPLVALAKSSMVFLKPPSDRDAIKDLFRQQGVSLLKCTVEELELAAGIRKDEEFMKAIFPHGVISTATIPGEMVLAGKEAAF